MSKLRKISVLFILGWVSFYGCLSLANTVFNPNLKAVKVMDIINDDSVAHTVFISGADTGFPNGLTMKVQPHSVNVVPHDGIDLGWDNENDSSNTGDMHFDNNVNIHYNVIDPEHVGQHFRITWDNQSWEANVYAFTGRAYVELHIHPNNKTAGGLIFNHTDHVEP